MKEHLKFIRDLKFYAAQNNNKSYPHSQFNPTPTITLSLTNYSACILKSVLFIQRHTLNSTDKDLIHTWLHTTLEYILNFIYKNKISFFTNNIPNIDEFRTHILEAFTELLKAPYSALSKPEATFIAEIKPLLLSAIQEILPPHRN